MVFDSIDILVWALVAFAAALVGVPAAARLAIRTGFVDAPGGRKDHAGLVPPVGGLVVFPVFVAVLFASGLIDSAFLYFIAGLAVIVFAGAMDDRFSISPRWKFVAQFIAAFLIVIGGGARVGSLGNLFGFGDVWLGWMDIPFSVVATVLLINAINLIDGLDGLAGGKSFVAFAWLLVACLLGGAHDTAVQVAVLMAALAGFLAYNMRHPLRARAAVFLGDSGSMALGLALAWFCITLAKPGTEVIQPISIAWILALPIIDTCAQFARRVAQGRHPFSADRNHFHHHFVNAGVSVGWTMAALCLIGIGMGAVGIGGMVLGVPEPVLSYAWIAMLLTHIYISLRPRRFRRLAAWALRCIRGEKAAD